MLELDRRQILKASLIGAAGLLAAPGRLLAADPTPEQMEGPFHPTQGNLDLRILKTLDKNTDLTQVDGQPGKARGQVLYVLGTVEDEGGQPVAGATVEIWQACFSGRYNHKNDASANALDPNFQYWGFAKTDAQGKYAFKTILPGAYRNDPSWIRPPHIHYKVRKPGWNELTTQLYFAGIPFVFEGHTYGATTLKRLNQKDQVLATVPANERSRVIVAPRSPATGETFDAGSKVCTFDIVMPN